MLYDDIRNVHVKALKLQKSETNVGDGLLCATILLQEKIVINAVILSGVGWGANSFETNVLQ